MVDYRDFYRRRIPQSDYSRPFHTQPKAAGSFTVGNLPPLLNEGERGGCVTNMDVFTRSGENGIQSGGTGPIDETLIRTAVLFVDKIDVPSNQIILVGETVKAIEGLKALGLVDRTMVMPSGAIGYNEIVSCPWRAYLELDKREPGKWSIWQSPDYPVIPKDELAPDLAFQLKITDEFISPGPNVPFDDVLMFKDRHKDELAALRYYIEETAFKLAKEGDVRLVNLELEKLELALEDYRKKAGQSNLSKVFQSFSVELDWSPQSLITGGAALAIWDSLPAAFFTGALSALKIKGVWGLKKADNSPFRYIVRAEREFS